MAPRASGRMVRKGDLPEKSCVACGRPFTWRKKWARVWESIETCSDRCRDAARAKRLGSRGRDPRGGEP